MPSPSVGVVLCARRLIDVPLPVAPASDGPRARRRGCGRARTRPCRHRRSPRSRGDRGGTRLRHRRPRRAAGPRPGPLRPSRRRPATRDGRSLRRTRRRGRVARGSAERRGGAGGLRDHVGSGRAGRGGRHARRPGAGAAGGRGCRPGPGVDPRRPHRLGGADLPPGRGARLRAARSGARGGRGGARPGHMARGGRDGPGSGTAAAAPSARHGGLDRRRDAGAAGCAGERRGPARSRPPNHRMAGRAARPARCPARPRTPGDRQGPAARRPQHARPCDERGVRRGRDHPPARDLRAPRRPDRGFARLAHRPSRARSGAGCSTPPAARARTCASSARRPRPCGRR